MFQRHPFKRRREEPNRTRRERTRSYHQSFRTSKHISGYLKGLSEGKVSKFINESIQRNIFLKTNPKAFLRAMLLDPARDYENYFLTKQILRKIGSFVMSEVKKIKKERERFRASKEKEIWKNN